MSTIDLLTLQAASEAFGNRIPDNWEEMTEAEQNDWLDNNRCEKYDYISTDEYYSLIDCHADTIRLAIKDVLIQLKEKLVNMGIEDEFPLDINELHLTDIVGV